jgi:predicted dinucleotide-binding enzyme
MNLNRRSFVIVAGSAVAVPHSALPDVGKELADLIDGKVVIDACNPFPNRDGEIADWAREHSAEEIWQSAAGLE